MGDRSWRTPVGVEGLGQPEGTIQAVSAQGVEGFLNRRCGWLLMWKYAPMNRTVAMVICLSLVATGACSGDGDAEDSPANRQGSFSLLSYNVAGLPEGCLLYTSRCV